MAGDEDWRWPLSQSAMAIVQTAASSILCLSCAATLLWQWLSLRPPASRSAAIWSGTILYNTELILAYAAAIIPLISLLVFRSHHVGAWRIGFVAVNVAAYVLLIIVVATYPERHHLSRKSSRPGLAERAPALLRVAGFLPLAAAGVDITGLLWSSEVSHFHGAEILRLCFAGILVLHALVVMVGQWPLALRLEFLATSTPTMGSVQEGSNDETRPLLRQDTLSAAPLLRLRNYPSVAQSQTERPRRSLVTINNRTPSDGTDFRAAEDRASLLSKLSLAWMNPLLVYGFVCQVLAQADLLALPRSLQTIPLCEAFSRTVNKLYSAMTELRPRHPLLAAFNRLYGWKYYPLGVVKLCADLSGFAGPILLHELVDVVERPSTDVHKAYIYAALLCASSFFGSICNTQYSFQVSKVQVAVRAAIVTSVFRKALRKRLGQPEDANKEKPTEQEQSQAGEDGADKKKDPEARADFSTTGQVVNLMSTDCDRIANFCPSFHQFWSLPVQVAVALYLLYRQVGISFLAGLAFAILAIPLNRWVANQIGAYSTAMMKHKDERIRLMSEILAGIRVVKAYAWEDKFAARVQRVRAQEVQALKGRKYLDAVCVYLWATTPVLISILTFATYALLGNQLTAAVVFTSMALFSILIGPLNAFPWVLNGMVEAWVSLKRVEDYLASKELRPQQAVQDPSAAASSAVPSLLSVRPQVTEALAPGTVLAQLSQVQFAWDIEAAAASAQLFRLTVPEFAVRAGELVVLWGPVAAGKSSLLQGLLGELETLQGQIELHPAVREHGIAYVGQEAWIQNATIEQNICCGLPLDQPFYSETLRSTALDEDLQQISGGDQAELGADGINISGGQKARINLARAVYQRKPLACVDDPLAALDPRVAEHVLDQCIVPLLRPRGCVLVTHNRLALSRADRIYRVEHGHVVPMSAAELEAFADGETSDLGDVDYMAVPETAVAAQSATGASLTQHEQPAATSGTDSRGQAAREGSEAKGTLIEEEQRGVGVVPLVVYGVYWRAVGTLLAMAVLIALFLMQASRNFSDWWLSHWVTVANHEHGNGSSTRTTDTFLAIYGGISGANTLFTLARAFLFAYAGVVAARYVERALLRSVLGATASFFDTNPTGRLINRFSSDVYGVDDSLPFIMNILFAQAFGLLGTLVVTSYSEPYFIMLLFPLGWIYASIQRYYRQTAREIKRLDSISRSPIYDHFGEALSGAATIRALRQVRRFELISCLYMDGNQVASYNELSLSQWLNFRLQVLGVAMLTGVAFLAAAQNHLGHVNAGLVGLSISYSLSVTGLLQGLVTAFTETEKEMVAVERAAQYLEAPQENLRGDFNLLQRRPGWPEAGAIAFHNVTMRYRPHLPAALNRISFTIPAGKRLGVVGRTGAGKSSLFQVLLRTVDLDDGQVTIDNVDIATVPRHELRRRIATIPQDPVLFSGTVRENLDPFEEYSDEAVWQALDRCSMKTAIQKLPLGLQSPVEERGRNFSVGQRQLMCAVRAILRRARVLCIDEATANVDLETDARIQQTLREDLAGCTVITIAHRIRTILDSDLVLVLGDGRAAEFGPPADLLKRPNGLLAALAAASRLGDEQSAAE